MDPSNWPHLQSVHDRNRAGCELSSCVHRWASKTKNPEKAKGGQKSSALPPQQGGLSKTKNPPPLGEPKTALFQTLKNKRQGALYILF